MLVRLRQKNIIGLRLTLALGVALYFLSLQILLGQDNWAQVSSPNNTFSYLDVFGETYYKMPSQFLSPNSNFGKSSQKEISLPNEKGEEEIFILTSAPLLSKDLSAKYPEINTFKGVSKSRPNVQIRMSTKFDGINAWIKINDDNDFFIQPVRGEKNLHFTYIKNKNDSSNGFFCKTEAANNYLKLDKNSPKKTILNDQIRTFRIAISSTGEYTSYWGDDDDSNGSNQVDALAAVVSTLNRINAIFEKDLNIRLELISDVSLLYEDKNTDPFNGNFASELQTTLDTEIGDAGYDLGHLFDFGEPNGDAGCVGCVCVSNKKGQGFSTHPFIDIYGGIYRNDYFDLDYAGHEIGHQFGAYHTFSYDYEPYGYSSEPGSGSTIMAYAGITGEDDLQQHGDPYFHYHSIKNILNYVESISCGSFTSIETQAFDIDAGPDYNIPIGTAYELNFKPIEDEGSYTYSWEQLDSAEITSDNFGPYNLTGAMARSLLPSKISNRLIPNIDRILSNNLTQQNPSINSAWETVPLVERTMNWGLTVRRQINSFNQLAQDKIKISALATSGPFVINSQDELDYTIKGGAVEIIEWDVANTDLSPIGENQVVISLSIDGGKTFPITLADGVSNNGLAKVIIPNNLDTSEARIKVKAKNGIFFALNSENFSIKSRDLVLNFDSYFKENCDSNSLRYNFNIIRKENFDGPFSLQMKSLPSSLSAKFSKEMFLSSDTSGFVDLEGFSGLDPGNYEFDLEVLNESISESFNFELKQRNDFFLQDILESPLDGSQDISLNPILEWESNINVDTFRIQVSKDKNFSSLLFDKVLSSSKIQLNKLESETKYYWRIQQINSCGTSDFSDAFSFQTNIISCVNIKTTDLPKDLIDADENGDGTTFSSINVNYDTTILDIDVLVDLTHSWVNDLILYLETPTGDRFLLSGSLGGENDNYTQTLFDQESSVNIDEGSAPFSGRFVPVQNISFIYGTSSKGIWKLIIVDQEKQDSGQLIEFELRFCLEGLLDINSDNDSLTDEEDNCPEITNEDQGDIDNNNIGDLCDIFSAQNISITKKDATCPNSGNGSLTFDARADYLYKGYINGSNGFQKDFSFTKTGYELTSLSPGIYDICIFSDRFIDFEYCYQAQITAPDDLNVQAFYNAPLKILNLDMYGGERYKVYLNDKSFDLVQKSSIQLPLTKNVNRVVVETNKICQGTFERWINLDNQAKTFPNPVIENANIILPQAVTVDLYLFSGSGEVFWTKKGVVEKNKSIIIPMSNLPTGWYVLQIDYGSHSENLKILKE
jgi:subtilisin-like proprotein convertase family protein